MGRGVIKSGELIIPGEMRLKSAAERAIVKKYLSKRDGKFCGICRRPVMRIHDMTIDHIIEKSKGGTNDISNLQIAHAECNFKKSRTQSPYLKRSTDN
jgi:5-methylcytosine-specific restriction endonuclease McrA